MTDIKPHKFENQTQYQDFIADLSLFGQPGHKCYKIIEDSSGGKLITSKQDFFVIWFFKWFFRLLPSDAEIAELAASIFSANKDFITDNENEKRVISNLFTFMNKDNENIAMRSSRQRLEEIVNERLHPQEAVPAIEPIIQVEQASLSPNTIISTNDPEVVFKVHSSMLADSIFFQMINAQKDDDLEKVKADLEKVKWEDANVEKEDFSLLLMNFSPDVVRCFVNYLNDKKSLDSFSEIELIELNKLALFLEFPVMETECAESLKNKLTFRSTIDLFLNYELPVNSPFRKVITSRLFEFLSQPIETIEITNEEMLEIARKGKSTSVEAMLMVVYFWQFDHPSERLGTSLSSLKEVIRHLLVTKQPLKQIPLDDFFVLLECLLAEGPEDLAVNLMQLGNAAEECLFILLQPYLYILPRDDFIRKRREAASVKYGCRAYGLGFLQSAPKIVRFLLEQGARKNKSNFLHIAIQRCIYEKIEILNDIIKLLIEYGDSVDALNQDGKNPLMYLQWHGLDKKEEIDAVQTLIDNGIDLSKRDSNGKLALHLAIQSNNLFDVQAMTMMLEKKPELINECFIGQTPLMMAALKEDAPDKVELLLKYSPDLSIKNRQGQTVIDILKSKIAQLGTPDDPAYLELDLDDNVKLARARYSAKLQLIEDYASKNNL